MFFMDTRFKHIKVILAHPEDAKNVGAVCRAMKTMNLQSLLIIGKNDLDTVKIRHLSVHAYDVYENALFFDTLSDAITDVGLVAGITRRRGKRRKYFTLGPEELAELIEHVHRDVTGMTIKERMARKGASYRDEEIDYSQYESPAYERIKS